MIKTNVEKVIISSVLGKIRQTCCANYRVDHRGNAKIFAGIGGIVYNVKLGDCAFGLAGDHVEPGVSIYNKDKTDSDSLQILSCIGNTAIIKEGDAKGARGVVIGKHGGAEDVIIHFDKDTLDKLDGDEKILIKACGQGLELLDYPKIKCQSLDPGILMKMGIVENGDKTISVPVVKEVPPYLMGSGTGATNAYRGDYDIMTADEEVINSLGLNELCFGDFVLLRDCDNVYGRGYRKGAVSIGVVVHSDCVLSGHGPGIVTVLACQEDLIKPIISKNANLKNYI